jgi:peptidoglycan/LPS O-acetylase OafA/YrhL
VLLALVLVYRVVLLVRGASLERIYYGPDTHADPLLVGCVFGCWFKYGRVPRMIATSRARGLVGGAALAVIVAAAVLLDHVHNDWSISPSCQLCLPEAQVSSSSVLPWASR